MKMKKTFLIVLLVMLIVLNISVVCFSEEITLNFVWWGGQDRADKTLKVVELFEKKYPNVKFETQFFSWNDYWEKLAVLVASGELPDIVQQEIQYISGYGERGLLLNLDPYVEDNRLNLTDASESEISGGKVNGKLYGVNSGSNCLSIVYDPELFKKAGVEEPTPEWTWEDFIEKFKKIHDVLKIYGIDIYDVNTDNTQAFEFYLRQHGQDFYDEFAKKLGYEDDKLFVDYFNMIYDLSKYGAIVPVQISSAIGHSVFDEYLITKQEAAAIGMSSNMIVALDEAAASRPLNLMIFPNAKEQVRYGSTIRPSQFFSVAKNSKHPEWAVKFVDFLTNDFEANKILLGERGVPISSKVRESIKPYLNDVQKKHIDYIGMAVKYSYPYKQIYPLAHSQIVDLLRVTYEKMLYNELTPEKAAKEFREKANKILAE